MSADPFDGADERLDAHEIDGEPFGASWPRSTVSTTRSHRC
jgi:hypothetical protein